MVYFIITFCILAILSFAVFLLFMALAIRTIRLVPKHERRELPYKTAGLRSFIMAAVWLVCAASLHLAVNKTDTFAGSLPTFILQWDIPYRLYGAKAAKTLYTRCVNDLLTREEVNKTSGLISGSQWWQDFHNQPVSEANQKYYDYAKSWFYYVCQSRQISNEHLQAYISCEPPPIFIFPAGDSATNSPYKITACFGRKWQVETDTPYVIDSLEISNIKIDDIRVNYILYETAVSEARKGSDATVVEYEITIQSLSDQAAGNHTLVIEYMLGVLPRPLDKVGPLILAHDFSVK